MEHEKDGKDAGRETKRPYLPPTVDETAQFETLALACGKTDLSCEYTGGTQNS